MPSHTTLCWHYGCSASDYSVGAVRAVTLTSLPHNGLSVASWRGARVPQLRSLCIGGAIRLGASRGTASAAPSPTLLALGSLPADDHQLCDLRAGFTRSGLLLWWSFRAVSVAAPSPLGCRCRCIAALLIRHRYRQAYRLTAAATSLHRCRVSPPLKVSLPSPFPLQAARHLHRAAAAPRPLPLHPLRRGRVLVAAAEESRCPPIPIPRRHYQAADQAAGYPSPRCSISSAAPCCVAAKPRPILRHTWLPSPSP